MIRFRLGKTICSLEFGFLGMLFWVVWTRGSSFLVQLLCACLIHEMGHFLAMCFFHKPVRRVRFHTFGILIQPAELASTYWQDFWILLCGPLANLILGAVCYGMQWTEMEQLHLGLGLCSLMPYGDLDGGQLFYALLLQRGCSLFAARTFCLGLSLAFTVGLVLLCVFYEIWNPMLFLGLTWLAISGLIRQKE
jgi:hypothetical protein